MNFNILLSEIAVISISESKLDDLILSSEIQSENYDLTQPSRNRHGGGVPYFIRNDLTYNTKKFISSKTENIFI